MTADAAGVQLWMAKLLFSCDISDRAGSNAPEIMGACERAAAVLVAAGIGDVAQLERLVGEMAAERDAALAVIEGLHEALEDVRAERDAALDEAACIADGFGIIGARPTDDDYWGGHNDASVKIAAAIRALAIPDKATS